jgi:hypothetical protein
MTLESSVELPELAPSTGTPARWRFSIVDTLPEMRDPREVGAERIYDEVHARLYTHRDGRRIVVDDTGAFDLDRRRRIQCQRTPTSWDDFLRGHLLGRVLATAMYDDGWLPLHGSAVATREGVIAFLAPKGFGKSSLALALAHAGAPLVTDDTLPIEPTVPPRAWPGVHSIRAREDALAALGVERLGETTRDGKVALRTSEGLPLATAPLPLAAIYLLSPSEDSARAEVVVRTPFSSTLAALAITPHVKVGAMLGAEATATMLERVATIANLVPVNQLSISRELARLPEAAAQLLEWYGGPAR